MKPLSFILLIAFIISTPCQGQENSTEIILNYNAQTRGFSYSLKLMNNDLIINKNNKIQKISLSKSLIKKVDSLLTQISFKEIENNVSIKDLAVDKAIKGVFDLNFKNKKYLFDFDHNNLPKEISELIQELERIAN